MCLGRLALALAGLGDGIGEAEGKDLGDAVVAHADAVEGVGDLDGAPVVGDDDDLGLAREGLELLAEADHVRLVQGGVDLVQEAERGRVDLQDGDQEGGRRQGAFAAGKQRQPLEPLTRRLGDDVDPAGAPELITLGNGQLGGPAAKQGGEGLGERHRHP